MIPKDPVMLLSFVNTQLRDHYRNLDELSDGLDINVEEMEEILKKLEGIGYTYDKENNKFI